MNYHNGVIGFSNINLTICFKNKIKKGSLKNGSGCLFSMRDKLWILL
ncbi:hypothetical protein [Alysiella crassa]|nr:hypothetical protein [Alysiella crassa]UOP07444.1 hypothetical protein LVJ80_03240 [Alysiella crassa]